MKFWTNEIIKVTSFFPFCLKAYFGLCKCSRALVAFSENCLLSSDPCSFSQSEDSIRLSWPMRGLHLQLNLEPDVLKRGFKTSHPSSASSFASSPRPRDTDPVILILQSHELNGSWKWCQWLNKLHFQFQSCLII